MAGLVRAWVGAGVVLVVPGYLIASLLGFRFRALLTWAAVPVFSLAAVFVLAEVLDVAGGPFGVGAFAILIVVLGMAVLARRGTRRDRHDVRDHSALYGEDRSAERDDVARERRVAYVLLALGIAIGAVTWARGLDGFGIGPAYNDGSHHAYFVARIIETNSVDPSEVLVTDPQGEHRASNFYPLAMHASAAIATRTVDAEIGRVVMAFLVIFGAVVLPLGMFVLARMLAPQRPLVAGFTALIVPSLTIFPYYPSIAGQVTMILGMAMVPVTVVLATGALTNTEPLRLSPRFLTSVIPTALALLTATSLHSTQLALIVFLVALLVLEIAWSRRSGRVLHNALMRGLAVTLLVAVLFAPMLVHLGGGYSERSSYDKTPITGLQDAIGPILTLRSSAAAGTASARQEVLAVVALLGAAAWLLMRRRPAWFVGWLTVIGLAVLASTSKGTISHALTLPWYREPHRVNYNQVFFVPFFASVVPAFAVTAAARLLRSRVWLLPASVAAVFFFITCVGLDAHRTTRKILQDAYEEYTGLKPESQRAYAFLERHARPEDIVVNDPETDGSLWMYPEAGLNPLLGLPHYPEFVTPDYYHRLTLRNGIAQVGSDRAIDTLVNGYHARWIYVDEDTFPATEHVLRLKTLHANPHISEVFRRGTVHVFKIDDPSHLARPTA